MDELLPRLTRDEYDQLLHEMEIGLPAEADDAERQELFRRMRMDTCRCCGRWLGHNRPPADDAAPAEPLKNAHRVYRRQTSFDFDR
jgi:hypothetical protein